MTLREKAVELVEASVKEAATKAHQRGNHKLHINRDGAVEWSMFASDDSDLIDRQAKGFAPVPSVISTGTSNFCCNCDYCNEVHDPAAEQLAKDEGRKYDRANKFETHEEAIEEEVSNSDLTFLEAGMLAELDRIPVGYFEDETESEDRE